MKNRIPELDGVRGIAILLVVLFHDFRATFQNGWLGVDIFFVLSGFLITSLLIAEHSKSGTINFKAFYLRRARRLFPAVAALLIVYSLLAVALRWPAGNTIKTIFAVVFYTANWAWAFHWDLNLAPLGQMWSLSIEEHFYMLWPVAFLAVRRTASSKKITALLLTVVCIVAIWRAFLFWQNGDVDRGYYGTDTRADGLLLGCLAAFIAPFAQRVPSWLAAFAFVLICWFVSMNQWLTPFFYFGGFTATACAVAVLLLWISKNQGRSTTVLLRFAPLVWVGQISYSLYLWHPLLQEAVNHYGRSWLYKVVSFSLSLSVAALSYYLIERPFLSAKKSHHIEINAIATTSVTV